MNKEELEESLNEYNNQLTTVGEALKMCTDDNEKKSLLSLQHDLLQLVNLTQESLETIRARQPSKNEENRTQIDEEYALFMEEMSKSGAYDVNKDSKGESSKQIDDKHDDSKSDDSDIEDELATLLGMKCAVYHTHKWGGEPSLHNAMVSAVLPRQGKDKFKDLQVRVLFTHPTHSEMLPCPFYLDGECRFDDEHCRYSHGALVHLSNLKEAFEPDFKSVKVGSRVLIKLKPSDTEDITLKKKSTEKYHLWHSSVVKSIDAGKKSCVVRLEHGQSHGLKRKADGDETIVDFENIFPLNGESVSQSDSEDSISDTEYPELKATKRTDEDENRSLVIEKSLQNCGPALGEWERHTRGIGSKLMFAMGYVAGSGLGATGAGRVVPVQARRLPRGRGLDHGDAATADATQDPLKIEQKLKRMQKREEERHKRAYEREKERGKRNVFNFLNRTIGDQTSDQTCAPTTSTGFKQSTDQDLNIEQFKLNEETRRLEKDIAKLNNSLCRHSEGTSGYRNVKTQIVERSKELDILKHKEQQLTKEQSNRKNKQKMTVF